MCVGLELSGVKVQLQECVNAMRAIKQSNGFADIDVAGVKLLECVVRRGSCGVETVIKKVQVT